MRFIGLLLLAPILQQNDPKIAAKINNQVITWNEVEEAIKNISVESESKKKELLKSTLIRMAENKLFLQEAQKSNITVTEQELRKNVEDKEKLLGGKEKFEDYLRFRKQTLTQFKEELRIQMIMQKIINIYYSKWWVDGTGPVPIVTVGPEEIKEYYKKNIEIFRTKEGVRALRLVMQFKNEDKDYKMRLANSLKRKVQNGHNFQILCIYYTDTKLRPDVYIDRENSIFTKENTDNLFSLAANDISDIIIDGNTINIFKVLAKTEKKDTSLEDATPTIKNEIENQKIIKNRKIVRDYMLKQSYVWPEELFKE